MGRQPSAGAGGDHPARHAGGEPAPPQAGQRPDGEVLLSPEQIAERWGVPRKSIYGYVHQLGLPAVKVGRHLRIRPSDLEAWLERQAVGR